MVTLGRIFQEWKLSNIPDGWYKRSQQAMLHLSQVESTLLDGHPTKAQLEDGTGKRGGPVSRWNVWCDKECGRLSKLMKEAEGW
jgi:hypothetical protein